MWKILLILVLGLSCGKDKDQTESSPVNDPEGEVPASVDPHVSPSTICLNDCTPLDDFKFDFGVNISFAIIDCKVFDYRIFPYTNGYQLIMKADCLQGPQVYSLALDADGRVTSSPAIVSSPCLSSFKAVKGFSAVKIAQDLVAVYSCVQTAQIAHTYFSKIGSTPVLIETFSPPYLESDYDLKVAWNESAQILALASKRGLVRLSAEGSTLGGRVNLNLTKPIRSLTTVGSSWYVLSRDASPYWNSKSYCSKVLSNGQLACDRKEFGGAWSEVFSESLAFQATTDFTENVPFTLAAFNSENCSMGPAQEMGIQTQASFALYGSGSLKTGFGWALSRAGSEQNATLNLTIFETHLAGKIQSTLAVANGNNTHPQVVISSQGIDVFYLDELNNLNLRKGVL